MDMKIDGTIVLNAPVSEARPPNMKPIVSAEEAAQVDADIAAAMTPTRTSSQFNAFALKHGWEAFKALSYTWVIIAGIQTGARMYQNPNTNVGQEFSRNFVTTPVDVARGALDGWRAVTGGAEDPRVQAARLDGLFLGLEAGNKNTDPSAAEPETP